MSFSWPEKIAFVVVGSGLLYIAVKLGIILSEIS